MGITLQLQLLILNSTYYCISFGDTYKYFILINSYSTIKLQYIRIQYIDVMLNNVPRYLSFLNEWYFTYTKKKYHPIFNSCPNLVHYIY